VATRFLGLRLRIPPGTGRLSLLSVVYCQVEVYATGRSLIQRRPTDCDVSLRVIYKPQRGGPGQRWAVEPEELFFSVGAGML
jgi:hypothetical protein